MQKVKVFAVQILMQERNRKSERSDQMEKQTIDQTPQLHPKGTSPNTFLMQMNFAEHNGTLCFGDIPKWLLCPPAPISGQNIDEVTKKGTDPIEKYCEEGRWAGSAGTGGSRRGRN